MCLPVFEVREKTECRFKNISYVGSVCVTVKLPSLTQTLINVTDSALENAVSDKFNIPFGLTDYMLYL